MSMADRFDSRNFEFEIKYVEQIIKALKKVGHSRKTCRIKKCPLCNKLI